MDVIVDYYKEEYLDDINKVLKEAFNIEKSNFSGEEFKEIVAIVDNKAVGYLLLTKVLNPIKNKYYYLVDYVCVLSNYRGLGVSDKLVDYVCVLSNYRGLGISDKLMKFAEDIALNDDAMYLQLTCGTQRVAAHKLYERCGYIKRDSDQFRKVLM